MSLLQKYDIILNFFGFLFIAGTADFVPTCIQDPSVTQFETMGAVVAKANAWLASQPGLPVINMQFVNVKVPGAFGQSVAASVAAVDTTRSLFARNSHGDTLYLRTLRVYYALDLNKAVPRNPVGLLSHKTFMPVQLTTGNMTTLPQYESMSDTMKRAMAWIAATGKFNLLATHEFF